MEKKILWNSEIENFQNHKKKNGLKIWRIASFPQNLALTCLKVYEKLHFTDDDDERLLHWHTSSADTLVSRTKNWCRPSLFHLQLIQMEMPIIIAAGVGIIMAIVLLISGWCFCCCRCCCKKCGATLRVHEAQRQNSCCCFSTASLFLLSLLFILWVHG